MQINFPFHKQRWIGICFWFLWNDSGKFCVDLKNDSKWEPQQWIKQAETELCRRLSNRRIFFNLCKIQNAFLRHCRFHWPVNYLLLYIAYFLFPIAVIKLPYFAAYWFWSTALTSFFFFFETKISDFILLIPLFQKREN